MWILALSLIWIICMPFPATAGGIFVNSQQSAEYIRLFNRNAATDNADIAYYNMAGLTKMEDGQYVNGSNMFFFQKATVETHNNAILGDREYVSDNPFLLFPNFYYVFKKKDWAAFCAYQTIGATAVREWEDGLPTLDLLGTLFLGGQVDSYLKGESAYYCLRIGGAKEINNIFSVGLSGRYVYTTQKVKGRVSSSVSEDLVIDAEDEGDGLSFSLNVNITPNPEWNIGITYEHTTEIELETSVNSGDNQEEILKPILGFVVFEDGRKSRLDLPQILRTGISYHITPRLRTEFSFNIYFEDNVNFSYLGDSHEEDYGNTYELGGCIEYTVSDRLKISAGTLYNWIGQDEDSTTDISIPGGHSDYITFAGGFQYGITENLLLNTGICYTGFVNSYEARDEYADMVSPGATLEYNKQYIVIALGAQYKF